MNKLTDRVVALGAMFQSLYGVNQIARSGNTDEKRLQVAVNSILTRDADSALEVYGGVANLRDGFILLAQLLSNPQSGNDRTLTHYGVVVMHLAKKLLRDNQRLDRLSKGIDAAQRSVEHFGLLHDNVFAGLADTWSRTAGEIPPRIMVGGEQGYLEDPRNANRIRALLLAAVRAAVLWHQKGGNRWNLILRRRALCEESLRLIGEDAHSS